MKYLKKIKTLSLSLILALALATTPVTTANAASVSAWLHDKIVDYLTGEGTFVEVRHIAAYRDRNFSGESEAELQPLYADSEYWSCYAVSDSEEPVWVTAVVMSRTDPLVNYTFDFLADNNAYTEDGTFLPDVHTEEILIPKGDYKVKFTTGGEVISEAMMVFSTTSQSTSPED